MPVKSEKMDRREHARIAEKDDLILKKKMRINVFLNDVANVTMPILKRQPSIQSYFSRFVFSPFVLPFLLRLEAVLNSLFLVSRASGTTI